MDQQQQLAETVEEDKAKILTEKATIVSEMKIMSREKRQSDLYIQELKDRLAIFEKEMLDIIIMDDIITTIIIINAIAQQQVQQHVLVERNFDSKRWIEWKSSGGKNKRPASAKPVRRVAVWEYCID